MAPLYGTLEFAPVQKKPAQKGVAVAALVLASAVMFFAGRVVRSTVSPYEYSEVVAASGLCNDNEYIGGCVDCSSCAAYEFANGGCSFFKDTFCSFCEAIPNCPREKISCTDQYDQTCSQCDCNDSIKNWSDVELGHFNSRELYNAPQYADAKAEFGSGLAEAVTFSCYFEEDCRPCSVCEEGKFQIKECTQNEDTQCQACSECDGHTWVSQVCQYDSDTVCSACTECNEGTYTSKKCSSTNHPELFTHFDTRGNDAECTECTQCDDASWVSTTCTEFENSACSPCSTCEDDRNGMSIGGEYVLEQCNNGDIFEAGADTVCKDCTDHPGVEDGVYMGGYWETSPCVADGTENARYQECTICEESTWESTPCQLGADTQCTDCTPINHCGKEVTVCSNGLDSTCPPKQCDANYFGEECCYMKLFESCGAGPGFKNYEGRKMGYEGSSNDEFRAWCQDLCDEFPDCIAFEIRDDGADRTASGEYANDSTDVCIMHNTSVFVQGLCHDSGGELFPNVTNQDDCEADGYTWDASDENDPSYGLPDTMDPTMDCFINVCRQEESRVRSMLGTCEDCAQFSDYTPNDFDIHAARAE